MFQNQIFQVKCFNLEIFEIFQTYPEQVPIDSQALSNPDSMPPQGAGQRVPTRDPRAGLQAAPE